MMILNSEERLDHFQEDAEGRKAIDLCNSISSIFKALRHQLDIQRRGKVAQNIAAAQLMAQPGQGGDARSYKSGIHITSHLQMMTLTHHCVNRRAILSKQNGRVLSPMIRVQQHGQTFNQRKSSLQNSTYQSSGLLETFGQNPLNTNRARDKKISQLVTTNLTGVPRQLPNAFESKAPSKQIGNKQLTKKSVS